MSLRIFGCLALVLAVVLTAATFTAPVAAHHAFATEFDANKPVTITGYVTRVQWTNPHTWVYLNVPDEDGQLEDWGFEMGSPTSLYANGWNRDSLELGEEIEVEGSLARDGSNRVNARNVTILRTGQLFGAASSEPEQ
jgi:DNA/RNA endonuclease YhcR with UshA esterase domain